MTVMMSEFTLETAHTNYNFVFKTNCDITSDNNDERSYTANCCNCIEGTCENFILNHVVLHQTKHH